MKSTNYVYRMKLTGYQVRTAIGILNERRLALKSQGCTLENSEEYAGVIRDAANQFQVSYKSMFYRLRELKLFEPRELDEYLLKCGDAGGVI